jgi:hypothetical protein
VHNNTIRVQNAQLLLFCGQLNEFSVSYNSHEVGIITIHELH